MKKKARSYRVVTFLNRRELDFLDSIMKDLYFTHGKKISRAKVMELVIDVFRRESLQAGGLREYTKHAARRLLGEMRLEVKEKGKSPQSILKREEQKEADMPMIKDE